MTKKLCRLTMMLSMLFSTALGVGLTSGVSNTTYMPTKQVVSYASEDDMNDHDTDHSSDYNWVSLEQSNFNTGGTYADGYLPGGNTESEMTYYYLKENVTPSTILTIDYNNFVTICLNGKTLTGTSSDSVIIIYEGANLTLCDCSGNDSGTITGGKATNGGGVYNNGTFTMYGGTITGNEVSRGGGGIYSTNSKFTMYGGTISDNDAAYGGGVYVNYSSTFNMYDGTITNNEASWWGGGVYVDNSSTYNVYQGVISSNTADSGGGIYIIVSTVTMYDGTISNNDTNYGYGGGICIAGETSIFTMYDGTISNNSAYTGGGVDLESGYFTMYGGTISNNNADYGAVCTWAQTFDMYGGTISGNTGIYAGGVYVYNDSTFNMYNGVITVNKSDYGGGVQVYWATFNMYGGTISSNEASVGGNGVYINSYTFNMYSGYLGDEIYNEGGTVSITGGYFTNDVYDSISDYIDSDKYTRLDISTLGTALDNNYVDGYPYALYAISTTEYSVEDVTTSTGSTYTPTIEGTYTSVAYVWTDSDGNTGTGLPIDVGEYAVTAHFLYTTTSDNITTNNYGTAEFNVTITENVLSAGVIAGIVIASVFVVGLIAFLVYFLFFRKKKAKK